MAAKGSFPRTYARGHLAGQHFRTQQDYQNALARARGLRSYAELRAQPTTIAPKDFGKLPLTTKASWRKAYLAVADVRNGVPLDQAARRNGIAPATVLKYAGDQLQRDGRRWVSKPFLTNRQWVEFLTERGKIQIQVPDPADRSLIASHSNAVKAWSQGEGDSYLRPFVGRTVRDASGKLHPLITDTAILRQLADAGELSFDSLYVFAS